MSNFILCLDSKVKTDSSCAAAYLQLYSITKATRLRAAPLPMAGKCKKILSSPTGRMYTISTAEDNSKQRLRGVQSSTNREYFLPFFNHTPAHDRFYEGERDSFNQPAMRGLKRNPRKKHPHHAELLSGHDGGRATLPTAASRSIWMTFHNTLPIQSPSPTRSPTLFLRSQLPLLTYH